MENIMDKAFSFFFGNEEKDEKKEETIFEKGYKKIIEKVKEQKKEFTELYKEYQNLKEEKDIEKIKKYLEKNKNSLNRLNEEFFQLICKFDFLIPKEDKDIKLRKDSIVQIQNICSLIDKIIIDLQFILLINDRMIILDDEAYENEKNLLEIIKYLHEEAEIYVKRGEIELAGQKGLELYKFRAKINKIKNKI
jgi:hypothetical protein